MMSTHTILAEKTVSISDLRKNPAQYFADEPVAVLSNNKPAGYMVSTAVFETLVKALEAQQSLAGFQAGFRPSAARLCAIAARGNERLRLATDEELAEFSE
jgi:antitoxin YafN